MQKFDFRRLRLSSGGYRYEKIVPCKDDDQNFVYKGAEGFAPVGGKLTIISEQEFEDAKKTAIVVAEYSDGSKDYKTA